MVDWKDLGKRTFDATKNITEKTVDSFQEWKDDPKRIAKVEKKKATKKAKKEIEEAERVQKKKLKKGKANRIMIIILLRKHSNPSLQRV